MGCVDRQWSAAFLAPLSRSCWLVGCVAVVAVAVALCVSYRLCFFPAVMLLTAPATRPAALLRRILDHKRREVRESDDRMWTRLWLCRYVARRNATPGLLLRSVHVTRLCIRRRFHFRLNFGIESYKHLFISMN